MEHDYEKYFSRPTAGSIGAPTGAGGLSSMNSRRSGGTLSRPGIEDMSNNGAAEVMESKAAVVMADSTISRILFKRSISRAVESTVMPI